MSQQFKNNQRMKNVCEPIIPIISELSKKNKDVISLAQGVVGYPPPKSLEKDINNFFQDANNHKYSLVQGNNHLLDAISNKLSRKNNIQAENYSVFVTAGSNMAFHSVILSICDPGDEIILLAPYYFNHEMAIRMANCKPVSVPTNEIFHIDIDAIEKAISKKTRAIVTISPNNPTGGVYCDVSLTKVNQICKENGIFHISDEAYEDFVYEDKKCFSPGSIENANTHTISLFSLSKSYGFAGWRIGYAVIPKILEKDMKKIQDTILICPPTISQYAAAYILNNGQSYVEEKKQALLDNRKIFMEKIADVKALKKTPIAEGAFYIFIELDSNLNDDNLAISLIEEHKVATIPGSAFGTSGSCYLRLSYGALSKDQAFNGMERLCSGLNSIL